MTYEQSQHIRILLFHIKILKESTTNNTFIVKISLDSIIRKYVKIKKNKR